MMYVVDRGQWPVDDLRERGIASTVHRLLSTMRWLIAASAIALSTERAHAQMQDFSLPPDESLRQPNITRSNPTGYGQHNSGFNGNAAQPYAPGAVGITGGQRYNSAIGQRLNETADNGNPINSSGNRFMDRFCDPNSAPVISGGAIGALQNCMQAQKQKSCQEFAALPADVQRAIDQSISCIYAEMDNGDTVAPTVQAGSDCSVFDSKRLRLLKKYWREPAAAQALVFMPDELLDTSANCMKGRH